MNAKSLIWGGMIVGSTVGSLLPVLWNGDFMATVVWSGVGGLAGIYLAFKLAKMSGLL